MTSKKNDSLDACPFPPDGEPPNKTLTTNMLEAMDSFFDGWRNTLLVLSLISILTVYSLFSIALPLIPLRSIPRAWNYDTQAYNPDTFEYRKSDFDLFNLTFIDEDIVLQGTDVLEFTDQTVQLAGVVYLRQNSTLVLRNSIIIVDVGAGPGYTELFDDYANMVFSDSSQLVMVNSSIIPSEHRSIIGFTDNSVLVSSLSRLPNATIWFDDSSSFQLDQTYIFELAFDREVDGVINTSKIEHLSNSNFYRVEVINPREVYKNRIIADDSEIGSLLLRIVGGSFELDSMNTGILDNWNSIKDLKITGKVTNITLTNTEIINGFHYHCYDTRGILKNINQKVGVSVSNSTFEIIDSNIAYVVSSRSNLLVNGSQIGRLTFSSYDLLEFDTRESISKTISNVTLVDTRVRRFSPKMTHMKYDNVMIDSVNVQSDQNIIQSLTSGGITYGPDTGIRDPGQIRLAVTHEFNVQTIGDTHIVPGVQLTLFNGSGVQVWSGVTDEFGQAEFNITFCNYYPLFKPYRYVTNYNDTWTLSASLGEETVEQEIRYFETGSPIVFEFPEPNLLSRIEFTPISMGGISLVLLILAVKLLKRD